MRKNKYKWEEVTDFFSEERRHYINKYLEIDEVYNEIVEVSLFSVENDLYEIYICFGKMYGIVYVEKDKAYALREEIKKVIAEEYDKNSEPSGDFINEFCEKYGLCLPNDLFFDTSNMFETDSYSELKRVYELLDKPFADDEEFQERQYEILKKEVDGIIANEVKDEELIQFVFDCLLRLTAWGIIDPEEVVYKLSKYYEGINKEFNEDYVNGYKSMMKKS